MEHVIVIGSRQRYEVYMPDFVPSLPIKISYFPVDTPWEEIARAAPDAIALAADAITPVPAELIRALPRLKTTGITHLKVVGRGAHIECMERDVRMLRRALEMKGASAAEIRREILENTCNQNCYYPAKLSVFS